MTIEIRRFATGPLETNTYVVTGAPDVCLVFDPSSGCDEVLSFIAGRNLTVAAVVLTHGHFDHIFGIPEIRRGFPDAPVWIHPLDAGFLTHAELNGSFMVGEEFVYDGPVSHLHEGPTTIGGVPMTVLHVPGHSPGGCAFVIDGACICGDTLFAASIGRSDLAGGDGDLLIDKIKEKLLALPAETVLWPGHMGRTTVGREKRANPFLR